MLQIHRGPGVGNVRLSIREIDPVRIIAPEIQRALFASLRSLATLHRLHRQEKPRGVLPSNITARPKTRGLTPRHEWLID